MRVTIAREPVTKPKSVCRKRKEKQGTGNLIKLYFRIRPVTTPSWSRVASYKIIYPSLWHSILSANMSTYGTLFRVTTYGESHCSSVGAIIDGCPPVTTDPPFLTNYHLILCTGSRAHRRRCPSTTQSSQAWTEQPHYSSKRIDLDSTESDVTLTQRNEKDQVHIQSGIERGVTLGTPIGLLVKNEDQRPHDYSETDLYPRPSHADYTYLQKYGIKASSGGGRSSARETIGMFFSKPQLNSSVNYLYLRSRCCWCYRRKIPQASVWHRDRRFRLFCWKNSLALQYCIVSRSRQ